MIRAAHLTVTYAGRERPTVMDASLAVAAGEMVLITGPTGCGKSTLLNCLNGILFHESEATVLGRVEVCGRDVRTTPLVDLCRVVGSVFQNPDSQLCTATVESEVAFGLENLAVDRVTMIERIREALDIVGLTHLASARTATLSGGQKQRLAIACALALEPEVLLLDEPISQLDPEGAEEILGVIARLRREHNRAVVVVEHRIEDVAALADRIVLMDQGRIVCDQVRSNAFVDLTPLQRLGLAVPQLAELFSRLGRSERPLHADEAPVLDLRSRPAEAEPRAGDAAPVLARLDGLRFRYAKGGPEVIPPLDMDLRWGERVALMGANGSGKSTLLHLLAGALKPVAGHVQWRADATPEIGLVLQQPDLMLFQETVRDEVAFAPKHKGIDRHHREDTVDAAIRRMGLDDLAGDAPFALSRGQRLRTAVASVLSIRPRVMLLDEPTTGQDRDQIERMMDGLAEDVDLLVFCTHDVETAARHANRVIVLANGRVAADGSPRQVLLDEDKLVGSRIRPTRLQEYGRRLGVKTLGIEELMAWLA
ncbi:MAG TPA: ATP-binding cassette domain-containing protein [Candidatus Hydrogenedentes bacterium]|mgnify:CR=1 FL=1|nr:ATP-binding cassette domain-containing protein [Candidatus Hydrogenedentota bacterium]HPG66757.1 ATP-binding cassette domain-containing protein [Candidatus Hydrogenedentota bacterium]